MLARCTGGFSFHHVLVRFRSRAKALPTMCGIHRTDMTKVSPK